MDDIVNLYTPANEAECRELPRTAASAALAVDPVHSDPAIQRRIRRVGKGDDYGEGSDSEDEATGPTVTAARQRVNPRPPQPQAQTQSTSNAAAGIELAAYVLSGVILIFMFESFITLGGSLGSGSQGY